MLVTENVTVKDATEGAEVPAGVWTVIGPVVAPGGTATLSDVAVTFVGTPNTPPAKLTRSALPKPVPLTFTMSPTSDTGIPNDQNTMNSQPLLIGQVFAAFPGTLAGDPVYIEFSGLHGGTTDLTPGGGGRGFVGTYDLLVTTDAFGAFTVTPVRPMPVIVTSWV